MTCYKLHKCVHFCKNIGHYTTYGIDAVDNKSNTLLQSFPDLTFEKNKISALIATCNKLRLDIVHLNDVVEDFISPKS